MFWETPVQESLHHPFNRGVRNKEGYKLYFILFVLYLNCKAYLFILWLVFLSDTCSRNSEGVRKKGGFILHKEILLVMRQIIPNAAK